MRKSKWLVLAIVLLAGCTNRLMETEWIKENNKLTLSYGDLEVVDAPYCTTYNTFPNNIEYIIPNINNFKVSNGFFERVIEREQEILERYLVDNNITIDEINQMLFKEYRR